MPYATANDIDSLIASKCFFTWFDNNLMKSNGNKYHLLVTSNEKVTIKTDSHEIANTKCENLLGLHLDSGLSFGYHISEICKKAIRKVCVLARVTSGTSLSKTCTFMNAFLKSQLNYCPFIWMCHIRKSNNKINRPNERCLRIIYNDKRSSFITFLEKMALFLFVKGILKFWQQKCSKLAKIATSNA